MTSAGKSVRRCRPHYGMDLDIAIIDPDIELQITDITTHFKNRDIDQIVTLNTDIVSRVDDDWQCIVGDATR